MANVNLFQFIVPLTFLAIWALTSLLNRDAQPLPPRPMRPPAPPGPGPRPQGGAMPTLRPGGDRRPEPVTRDQPQRWQNPPGTPRPAGSPRSAGRPDDDILIIEVEPRRGTGAGGVSPAPRKGSRGRANQPAPPKRQDQPTPRALSASLGHEAAGQLNRHMDLNPLAKLQTPLSAPVSKEVAVPPAVPPLSATLAGLTSAEILTKLNSPAKLREAIVLNELLRPPVALRGDRRVL